MPSNYLTTQGQAWDQISLDEYDDEKLMHELPPANVAEADTVLFGGEVSVAVPEVETDNYTKSVPPWERI